MDAPVLGAQDPTAEETRWQASFTWRWQRSDRHFRGSHEETNRQAEHSEVINNMNLMEFGLRYRLDDRWSVSLGVPVLLATRSLPIRDENRDTIGRSLMQARGVGDVTCTARRWMFDPATHSRGNIQMGVGIKLPTGANNVNDTRVRYVDGEFVSSVETVDQSIQPGDGGLGLIVDMQSFRRFADDRAAFYFSGTYLVNPDGTNGVRTYRSRESEAVMSVADQYLVRTGLTWFPGSRRVGWSLGGRIEGVPWDDLIGSSDGFRRPGRAISVEPGFSYTRGRHSVSLAVPIAVYRNRTRSVPDRMEAGQHGDAAFADYLVVAGYWIRF